jgi:hypothetical protein
VRQEAKECVTVCTEVEYKAMVDAIAELMWIQSVLQELRIPHPPSARLRCDNMGAKYLASNPVFHSRMKHFEVDYHFVRDRVVKKLLDVRFISTNDLSHGRIHQSLVTRKTTRIPTQSQLDKVVIEE